MFPFYDYSLYCSFLKEMFICIVNKTAAPFLLVYLTARLGVVLSRTHDSSRDRELKTNAGAGVLFLVSVIPDLPSWARCPPGPRHPGPGARRVPVIPSPVPARSPSSPAWCPPGPLAPPDDPGPSADAAAILRGGAAASPPQSVGSPGPRVPGRPPAPGYPSVPPRRPLAHEGPLNTVSPVGHRERLGRRSPTFVA